MMLESPLHASIRRDRSTALPQQAAVTLSERLCDHINLRGNPADPAWLDAIGGVLGYALPLEPNTYQRSASAEAAVQQALWLGPSEWLLLAQPATADSLLPRLRDAAGATPMAVTDLSGGQTVIRVGGERVREVLGKGCGLDLHPRSFGGGRCAQTLLAKTGVLLWQAEPADDGGAFELVVRRSFADYCWRWLEDAAADCGLAILG